MADEKTESIEDWRARVNAALIEAQILQPFNAPGAQAQVQAELDWNGFDNDGPEAVVFLYPRRETDTNTELVRVSVEEQPEVKPIRDQVTGAVTYDQEQAAAYNVWRAKALPKQPGLDFKKGELQQGTGPLTDFKQALLYSYESQTGYFPPNPPEGEGNPITGQSTL